MKITELETIRLGEFPNIIWVRIHTDEGLTGEVGAADASEDHRGFREAPDEFVEDGWFYGPGGTDGVAGADAALSAVGLARVSGLGVVERVGQSGGFEPGIAEVSTDLAGGIPVGFHGVLFAVVVGGSVEAEAGGVDAIADIEVIGCGQEGEIGGDHLVDAEATRIVLDTTA